MFDIGFWELTIIGVVALVIVGPERLPGLARTVGLWVGKGRRMISEVKRDIDRELKASEMSDLNSVKTEFDKVKKQVGSAKETLVKSAEVDEVKSSLEETVDEVSPLKQEIKQEFDQIDQVVNEVSGEIEQVQQDAKGQVEASPGGQSIDTASRK